MRVDKSRNQSQGDNTRYQFKSNISQQGSIGSVIRARGQELGNSKMQHMLTSSEVLGYKARARLQAG